MGDPTKISPRSLASKNYRSLGIVLFCFHDPTFSDFGIILTCDRQTDSIHCAVC